MDEIALEQAEESRELLLDAQENGLFATLGAYTKLSGPGWLQSAITLGGGSLSGALFLGVLAGTSMLWLQLLAIFCGVIMLSAISYVVLSTGERPFRQINRHINPVLGWGWIIATILANIIWCMPQFGLAFEALQKNLVPGGLGDDFQTKTITSAVLLVLALIVLVLNRGKGVAFRLFDLVLKGLVGLVVICFFGVCLYLGMSGKLDWAAIGSGLIPDLNQWNEPAARLQEFLANVPEAYRDFWKGEIIANQRSVMIGAAATAVGINMTFLLPYSMLDRGWDKPFRGLARFDLSTGMAIPYILVTSCVVIAASSAFHAQADADFLSNDPVAMQKSNVFGGATKVLTKRLILENESAFEGVVPEDKAARVAELASQLSEDEKQLAAALVKRNAFHLSESLAPLLGEGNARMVFGIGVFAMGFSTIIILMLINGYAFCEIFNQELGGFAFYFGALLSGVAGASWFYFWSGDSRFWLTIVASIFGMMLLPIAYFTFLLMMNSRKILRDEKPTGLSMMVWNVLMVFALVGAILGAGSAIATKASDPKAGPIVIGMAGVYLVLVVLGFVFKSPGDPDDEDEDY